VLLFVVDVLLPNVHGRRRLSAAAGLFAASYLLIDD
jgi:hypothetical protein